jgi:dienelactone hydrolase
MKTPRSLPILAVGLLVLAGLAASAHSAGIVIPFHSLDETMDRPVQGTLYLPEHPAGRHPALVVVHGTAGIDARGAFYRDTILGAGIAMFEVDFRTGVYTSAVDRPAADLFVPLGFAALTVLRQRPDIDPRRIGIMGFSLGGHLAVNTAFEKNRKRWLGTAPGFATHLAFYPVCKAFLTQRDCRMTGAPLIIFYGTADAYGEGANVPAFRDRLAQKFHFTPTLVEYAGACHGFNRPAPPMSYRDPAAIGGRGYMAWSAAAANDSLSRVADFLRQTLLAP